MTDVRVMDGCPFGGGDKYNCFAVVDRIKWVPFLRAKCVLAVGFAWIPVMRHAMKSVTSQVRGKVHK